MLDGRLPGLIIDRRIFEQHLGPATANKVDRIQRQRVFAQYVQRAACIHDRQGLLQVQASGVERGAVASGCHASYAESQIVILQ